LSSGGCLPRLLWSIDARAAPGHVLPVYCRRQSLRATSPALTACAPGTICARLRNEALRGAYLGQHRWRLSAQPLRRLFNANPWYIRSRIDSSNMVEKGRNNVSAEHPVRCSSTICRQAVVSCMPQPRTQEDWLRLPSPPYMAISQISPFHRHRLRERGFDIRLHQIRAVCIFFR
jgi:hypothetical protein